MAGSLFLAVILGVALSHGAGYQTLLVSDYLHGLPLHADPFWRLGVSPSGPSTPCAPGPPFLLTGVLWILISVLLRWAGVSPSNILACLFTV